MNATLEKKGKVSPKAKSVVADAPAPAVKSESLASVKDLALSQQLELNRLNRRLAYVEQSFKNLVDLSRVHGGSFAKFQFVPLKEE